MSSFNWESFLRKWSHAILESMKEDQLAQLPPTVIESGWLGFPAATEEQISQAESRLGVKLPPSYREFLKVTNGWRQTTSFIHRLWSTEGIERFAARHQKWIEAFTNHHENTQISFDYAIELDELWEPFTVADEEYFVYGEEQDCSKLRVEYLKTAIEISDVGESSIYLLNPQVVTEEGEWEAWFFGDWLPGADRYRSFQDMMEAEYHNFLELRDVTTAHSGSVVELELPEMKDLLTAGDILSIPRSQEDAEPLVQEVSSPPSESASKAEPEIWRSLKRLTVEFQTRRKGGHLEYRTVAVPEGEPKIAWSTLEEGHFQQWLREHLKEDTSRFAQPTQATAPSAAISRAEDPASFTSTLTRSALALSLKIAQLTIRQDSRLFIPILVHPTELKQSKRTEFASLISQHPFALEVVIDVLGENISELASQAVTYQTQFHVKNQMTGEWFQLGETHSEALVSDRRSYTAYLFGQTLKPGIYRLQILTTLRGAAVALQSFELPLLNVI